MTDLELRRKVGEALGWTEMLNHPTGIGATPPDGGVRTMLPAWELDLGLALTLLNDEIRVERWQVDRNCSGIGHTVDIAGKWRVAWRTSRDFDLLPRAICEAWLEAT